MRISMRGALFVSAEIKANKMAMMGLSIKEFGQHTSMPHSMCTHVPTHTRKEAIHSLLSDSDVPHVPYSHVIFTVFPPYSSGSSSNRLHGKQSLNKPGAQVALERADLHCPLHIFTSKGFSHSCSTGLWQRGPNCIKSLINGK